MSPEQMRLKVREVYDSYKWKLKVDKMKDNQVIAIYMRFLEEGRIK